ncbi:MAG: phosphoribosyltransferase family protein [Candidatus Methanofastidiosia archaeon]
MKKFILCSGAQHLQKSFERKGVETFVSEDNYDSKRFFMNADIYSRLPVELFEKEEVVVVQSATLSQFHSQWYTTQDRIFELLEFLSILNNPQKVENIGIKRYLYKDIEKPSKIEVVYTCMPCAKQDHACLTGEVNSAKLSLDLTLAMSDGVYILDPHPPPSLEWFGKLINENKVKVISMTNALLSKAKKEMLDVVVLGPDEGAKARLGINSFSKSRSSSVESTISGAFDVKGNDVLVVDDMVLSGGTLRKTREKLKELGARNVGAACTHALPVWGGEKNLEKIRDAFGKYIFVSNTVYSKTFEDMALDCVDEILKNVC